MKKTRADVEREYYTSPQIFVFIGVQTILFIAGLLAYYFQV